VTLDVDHLADRLFSAIERGDVEAVAACYAPDTIVWHNYDGVEQSAADNLAVLRWLIANVDERRYTITRRVSLDDGFVQQHVLTGRTRNGIDLHLPACLVCRVRDGLVVRIDEYLDTAHLAPLLAATGARPS